MSAIGGPGGIGGPKGPKGPNGPDAPEHLEGAHGVDETQGISEADELSGPEASAPGTRAQAVDIDRLVADLRAGKLTPREAVNQLVAQVADAETLPVAERAELRELMTDLLANDPHLAALIGRIA